MSEQVKALVRIWAALLLLPALSLPAGAQEAFEPQTWLDLAHHASATGDWAEAAALWSGLSHYYPPTLIEGREFRNGTLLALAEARIGQGYRGQAREAFTAIARFGWPKYNSPADKRFKQLEEQLGLNNEFSGWDRPSTEAAPILPSPEPLMMSWPDDPDQLRVDGYGRLVDHDYTGRQERGDYIYHPERDRWEPAPAGGAWPGGDSCQIEEQGGNPDIPAYERYSDFYLSCRDAAGKLWLNRRYLGTPPVDEDYRLLALGRKRELLIATGNHYTISRNHGASWQPIALPEVRGDLVKQRDGSWLLPSNRGLYVLTLDLSRWRLLALANESIDQVGLSPDGSWWVRSGGLLKLWKQRDWLSLPLAHQPLEALASGLWIQRNGTDLAWSRDLVHWRQTPLPAHLDLYQVSLAALGESVWLVNKSQLWHLDLKTAAWKAVTGPATPLAVAASGQTLLLASEGGYYRWAGQSWAKTGTGLPEQTVLRVQTSVAREVTLPLLAQLSEGAFRSDYSSWQPIQKSVFEYHLFPGSEPSTPILEAFEPADGPLTLLWQKYPDAEGRPRWSGSRRGLYRRDSQGWHLEACRDRWVTDFVMHPQGAQAAVCDDAVWLAGPQGWHQLPSKESQRLSLQLLAVDDGFLHLSAQGVTRFDLQGQVTQYQPMGELKLWSRDGDRWLLLTRDQRLWLSTDQGRSWKAWALPEPCKYCGPSLEAAMFDGDQIRLLYDDHWASLPLSRLTGL